MPPPRWWRFGGLSVALFTLLPNAEAAFASEARFLVGKEQGTGAAIMGKKYIGTSSVVKDKPTKKRYSYIGRETLLVGLRSHTSYKVCIQQEGIA